MYFAHYKGCEVPTPTHRLFDAPIIFLTEALGDLQGRFPILEQPLPGQENSWVTPSLFV